jgi:hypothetical protein
MQVIDRGASEATMTGPVVVVVILGLFSSKIGALAGEGTSGALSDMSSRDILDSPSGEGTVTDAVEGEWGYSLPCCVLGEEEGHAGSGERKEGE